MALAAAGGLHLSAAHEHLVAPPYVFAFFVVAAFAQVAAAWLLITRPSRRFAASVVVGSAGLLAVWALSRTVGVPLSGEGVEAAGALDITTAALELVAIVLLIPLMVASTPSRHPRVGLRVSAFVVAVAALAGIGAHFAIPTHDHPVASRDHAVADAGHSHP